MPNSFINLAVTVGDGIGANSDVSALVRAKTIIIEGPYDGVVFVEGSTDGTNFAGLVILDGASVGDGKEFPVSSTLQFMRVRRTRVGDTNIGTPVVGVGAETV